MVQIKKFIKGTLDIGTTIGTITDLIDLPLRLAQKGYYVITDWLGITDHEAEEKKAAEDAVYPEVKRIMTKRMLNSKWVGNKQLTGDITNAMINIAYNDLDRRFGRISQAEHDQRAKALTVELTNSYARASMLLTGYERAEVKSKRADMHRTQMQHQRDVITNLYNVAEGRELAEKDRVWKNKGAEYWHKHGTEHLRKFHRFQDSDPWGQKLKFHSDKGGIVAGDEFDPFGPVFGPSFDLFGFRRNRKGGNMYSYSEGPSSQTYTRRKYLDGPTPPGLRELVA